MTQDRLLEIARSLGASIEPIGDIWRMTYEDGTTQDFTFEEAANIIAEEVAKSPPPGWDSYLQQSEEGIASIFGQWPPLKREEVKTPTGTEWKPIPIEEGGFDWDFFDSFNAWIIQQEGRVVEAPQYFTGINAWAQAENAKYEAEEASRGRDHTGAPGPIQQEWEIVGVPGPEQAYYIQPAEYVEQLLETKEDGTRVYGYKETGRIIRYEYPPAPGAPASTYLGIKTEINPSTKKPYTFHATGYIDENDDEKYTRIDLIPEEDPEYKFLGKTQIGDDWYYSYGYIDSDGNPFVIDATPVPTDDPTETLLRTEDGVEYYGYEATATDEEQITRTAAAPVPRDPTQQYLGRDTDDRGREVDLYGHRDPTTGRMVITGRQYLQDIEPDEVFLGTVDDGGWRIDQYGYTDPDTGRSVVTRRQSREPIRDPILSVDDMIAQALGKVDDWSDLGDPNLQRAQSLFDFKRQPTDAERLRLAMDIAQSPSDYMTLVGLYTGAISRESPARAGERMAPLAPYLQQMAQKFFLDVPGINEMAPRRQPAQPAQPAPPAAAAPSVIPTAAITAPAGLGTTQTPVSVDQATMIPQEGGTTFLTTDEGGISQATEPISAIAAPSSVGATQIPASFEPATATSSLPFYYQQQNQAHDTAVFAPSAIDTSISSDDLSADPDFLAKMYSGMGHPTQTAHLGYPEYTGTEEEHNVFSPPLMIPVKKKIQDLKDGGRVHGPIGSPQIIQAHGGETVIPNPIQGEGMLPEYGVWRPPSREFSRQVVKPGTKGLIPSTKESAIRFRSPQAIRYMTPSQRMLFQEDVESTFDVPYEDWRMQEMLSTGAGGSGRPRIQFRRPSFVRG
jgi:hypothetical protein